jgi:uncharacterized membrane protein YhaH (DUF805 family)
VQNSDASNAAIAALASVWLVLLVVFLAIFILQLVIAWRIAEKAGYSGPLSLLMLIPFVNFVVLLIFAFSEWPIEARLKALPGGTPPGRIPPSAGTGVGLGTTP